MKPLQTTDPDKAFEPFIKLIQVMRDDPLINEKVIEMLNLGSYQRRIILNNWLEQLHRQNAPEKLIQTLSYLFDDIVAEKTLKLINRSQ